MAVHQDTILNPTVKYANIATPYAKLVWEVDLISVQAANQEDF